MTDPRTLTEELDELGIQTEPGTETGRHKPERKPHEISGPIWTPSKPGEEPPF